MSPLREIEGLFFQSREALFDLPTQGDPICIDLVHAERHQIIDVALDLFHVANQEKHLEQVDIERLLQAGDCLWLGRWFS